VILIIIYREFCYFYW